MAATIKAKRPQGRMPMNRCTAVGVPSAILLLLMASAAPTSASDFRQEVVALADAIDALGYPGEASTVRGVAETATDEVIEGSPFAAGQLRELAEIFNEAAVLQADLHSWRERRRSGATTAARTAVVGTTSCTFDPNAEPNDHDVCLSGERCVCTELDLDGVTCVAGKSFCGVPDPEFPDEVNAPYFDAPVEVQGHSGSCPADGERADSHREFKEWVSINAMKVVAGAAWEIVAAGRGGCEQRIFVLGNGGNPQAGACVVASAAYVVAQLVLEALEFDLLALDDACDGFVNQQEIEGSYDRVEWAQEYAQDTRDLALEGIEVVAGKLGQLQAVLDSIANAQLQFALDERDVRRPFSLYDERLDEVCAAAQTALDWYQTADGAMYQPPSTTTQNLIDMAERIQVQNPKKALDLCRKAYNRSSKGPMRMVK